ncbi:GH32 C-terminal domain-containing protein [Amphibacillus indicireducens]|uniref:Fructan beta-fructosidase n=1 Tax=Amphibacillus indicireducens TaxID=1076330 RepID=A0ABP7V3K2_9BACI
MKKHLKKALIMALVIIGLLAVNQGNQFLTTAKTKDYYTELYRPQYHFSTPEGRLADPNGLIYFNNEYHLFHQKMGTWAHAVSDDLLHWKHLPIALEHDKMGQAMSGTTVIDWNNTSGLFEEEPGMVAIYTSTEGGEAQSIAYSKDNGRNWQRYNGNPVIENPGKRDFRDPKVFWHEDSESWVMVVSTDKTVTFYNSSNLLDWEYQSVFGIDEDETEHGSHIAVWETPDFFPLAVDGDVDNQKWVLTLSIGDNPIKDGSTNQYFIGDFDGSTFTNSNEPEEVLYTDYGRDFYAGQSFNEVEESQGRRVWLGWMANWRYPYQSPTSPWMGSMSIPRELSLKTNSDGDVRLFQEPIKEIERIRATEHHFDSFTLNNEDKSIDFTGISYEFELIASWDDLDEFGIRLRQSEKEETVVGVDLKSNTVYLDRTDAGLDQLIDRDGNTHQFGKRFDAELNPNSNEIIIRGFVDESSVELFINDGEIVFTNLIYSEPTSNGIELFAVGGELEVESLKLHHLSSVWRPEVEDDELERIVANQENINLSVDESTKLITQLKPDWFTSQEDFDWVIANPEIVQIERLETNEFIIHALQSGQTTIEITHPTGEATKVVNVTVWDEGHPGYMHGWGPSPFHGNMSGNWDIIDDSHIYSHSGSGQAWTNIYRKEIITGDFTVSTNIKWIDQGSEGFPKYGINIADQEGSLISGFFNNDINKLETNAQYKTHDIGWEGIDLPSNTDLTEPQKLTIERVGNNFLFYFNNILVFERDIEIDDEVSIGIINENTQAEFTQFMIKQDVIDDGDGDSNDKLDEKIRILTEQIEKLEAMIENNADLQQVINELRIKIANLEENDENLSDLIADLQARIDALESQITETEDGSDSVSEEDSISNGSGESSNDTKSESGSATNHDPDDKEDRLPATATSVYNYLLIGSLVLLIGTILTLYSYKRKKS